MNNDIFEQLSTVIASRRNRDPDSSYVASLFHKGQDKILEKVGEEAIETILASKTGDADKIIYETADLWFHSMIMLSYHGLSVDDVANELARRFGVSGHHEKKMRPTTSCD
ncbi:MAG: phosphoribosyl-ATP diphosphatase [Mariprofundaceae bacterium]|nr:phosphoribosyl-ATP diphosphatase [Mariprofundaceae bacterium]